MKRALVMLVTVVLSLPILSFGGSDSIGHTKSAVGNSKGNSNNSGTLTVAPSASGTSIQTTTQPAGLNPVGFGTPTIDGVMSPGEWDNAVKIDFQANIPPSEWGGTTPVTTPATLYIMNDGLNLYFAVKVARPSFGLLTELDVDFDNNNIGIPVDGDDSFQILVGNNQPVSFVDTYRFTCPGAPAGSAGCNVQDPVGYNNGDGKAGNNGSVTILEVSKLLSSQDVTHDFSLKPGSKVGYHAALTLTVTKAPSNTMPTMPMGPPTGGQIGGQIDVTSSATTQILGTGSYYGQIAIVSPIVTRVISIKPGSREKTINRKSEGKIRVAILSAADFNAPQLVNRTSLTFGHTGDEQSLAFCHEGSEDVNGDGLPDLVCHFKTEVAGFQSGDSFGIVNGRTTDGSLFTAKDSVRIVQ